jgi:hypothetical protein
MLISGSGNAYIRKRQPKRKKRFTQMQLYVFKSQHFTRFKILSLSFSVIIPEENNAKTRGV